jgi:hypothetical protein
MASLGWCERLASYWALLTLCASSLLGRMTSVACTILRSDDIARWWLGSSHQRVRGVTGKFKILFLGIKYSGSTGPNSWAWLGRAVACS